MSLGGRVRALRRAKKWSAETLAAKVGKTTNHVYVIERDDAEPKPETVRALARALGTSVEYLRTGVEPKK